VERILQYLDDLDDAVYALAMLGEIFRRIAASILRAGLVVAVGAGALVAGGGHMAESLVVLNVLLLVSLYASLARDHMLAALPGV